jgi:hypothetical protein
MTPLFANNANTTLAAGISSSTTTILLATGTGAEFPSPTIGLFFTLTLNDQLTGNVYEICYCTARTGDSLTVMRGQEGTTAVAWLLGDYAYNAWTAGTIADITGGRLLNTQYFTTPGTFTYTPTAGTNKVFVRVQGADGAGGGLGATNSAQIAAAGGGGGGGYLEKTLTSGFSGATIVVGASGVGASASSGGTGGTSSFGAYGATGGSGGGTNTVASTSEAVGFGGAGGGPTGGYDLSTAGRSANDYIVIGGISAGGGVSVNGFPGFGVLSDGGGVGQTQGVSQSATVGLNGSNGCVIVDEYN